MYVHWGDEREYIISIFKNLLRVKFFAGPISVLNQVIYFPFTREYSEDNPPFHPLNLKFYNFKNARRKRERTELSLPSNVGFLSLNEFKIDMSCTPTIILSSW